MPCCLLYTDLTWRASFLGTPSAHQESKSRARPIDGVGQTPPAVRPARGKMLLQYHQVDEGVRAALKIQPIHL